MIVVTVARKPLKGTVAACALGRGTGALNLFPCRIGVVRRSYKGSGRNLLKMVNHGPGDTGIGTWDGSGGDQTYEAIGRWPTNLVISAQVTSELDIQSGEGKSTLSWGGLLSGPVFGSLKLGVGSPVRGFEDCGGASRFFKVVSE